MFEHKKHLVPTPTLVSINLFFPIWFLEMAEIYPLPFPVSHAPPHSSSPTPTSPSPFSSCLFHPLLFQFFFLIFYFLFLLIFNILNLCSFFFSTIRMQINSINISTNYIFQNSSSIRCQKDCICSLFSTVQQLSEQLTEGKGPG